MPTSTLPRPASRRPDAVPVALIRSTNIGGKVPPSNFARSAVVSMCAGTRNGSSITIAVSSSCSACVEDIARMPSRANRAKSTASSSPVMLLACSHRPQPSEIAGRPCLRRCTAKPSRKLLAAE